MIGLVIFNCWWLGWLALSNTNLNPLLSASFFTQLVFILWVVAFNLGAMLLYLSKGNSVPETSFGTFTNARLNKRFNILLSFILISVTCLLYKSGALTSSYYEYFIKLRGEGSLGNSIASGFWAYYLKFICYSISLALLSILFSNTDYEKIYVRFIFVLLFFLGFSYYFQVNYPVMTLAYIIMISVIDPPVKSSLVRKRRKLFFSAIFLLAIILIFSAFGRYGSSNFLAVMNHYLISYNTLGFVFFDEKINDVNSVLHSHTFGMSFLGSLEYVFVYLLNMLGDNFSSLSTIQENVHENMVPLYLSKDPSRGLNAFGTILFTFYRDFGLFGVAFLGVVSGFFTFKFRYLGKVKSRVYYACYIFLLQSMIAGIGVSPFDFPYFWSTVIFIFIFGKTFTLKSKEVHEK